MPGAPSEFAIGLGCRLPPLVFFSPCLLTQSSVATLFIAGDEKERLQVASGMFFLIRTAFWFSLVLLFLPIWPAGQSGDPQPVGAIRAISAAQQAVSDISGICERKPDVCETGRIAAQTIGVRARESARIAYEMLETTETSPESVDDILQQETDILPTPRPEQ